MGKLERIHNYLIVGMAFVIVVCLVVMTIHQFIAVPTEMLDITVSDLAVTDIFEYEGDEVMLSGYISPYSPADGSFIYLMSTPYNSKPYDTVGAGYSLDGVHIFPLTDMQIVYTAVPVTVKGTVVVDKTLEDVFGIRYDWSLCDAEVMSLNSGYMTETLYTYSEMVSFGLLDTLVSALYAVDYDLHYDSYGATVQDLQPYDTVGIAQVVAYAEANEKDGYSVLSQIAKDTQELLERLNKEISEGKAPQESSMYVTYESIYNNIHAEFYEWLLTYKL